jgi:hypothetical protein
MTEIYQDGKLKARFFASSTSDLTDNTPTITNKIFFKEVIIDKSSVKILLN